MDMVIFLLALAPILWLMIALSLLKLPAFKACPIALVIAAVLSVIIFKLPATECLTGGLEGVALALWPICLVIVAAIFTYNLCTETGSMDCIKEMLSGVSKDKRILVLIIGWCFGGFMEGMAGFGTAIAIPASMLCGMGFSPIAVTVACLVANSSPTAFGSVGIPTVTLAKVAGLSSGNVAFATVLQLLPFIILTPFLMVCIIGGSVKALKGVWPVALVAGLSFAIPELLAAWFLGAELPVIIGSICSMAVTIGMVKKFYKDLDPEYAIEERKPAGENKITGKKAVKAWMPFLLIFVFLLLTSNMVPPVNKMLSAVKTSVLIYTGEGASPYTFTWLATPGVLILIAAIIGGRIQGAGFKQMAKVFLGTVKQMWKTIVTIVTILAMSKIMGYSGMIAAIAGTMLALTGSFYPLVAPLVGALGAFVTGSGTSSSVLFGSLQAQTAASIGVSPVWLASASTVGATIGKIISPQSIAIGAGAAGLLGFESKVLNHAVKYSGAFILIAGCMAYFGSLIY
ncbi:L-lactate permease [Clostridium sp. HBUAS56010]|uniref:L-lactate permease n=1 Tax=Clostridium sp. HBUAS56010 TaxID=2571127 RepID=UPI00117874D9|nr:L-lactate permease [Clostridium sp. HBUAS56010]